MGRWTQQDPLNLMASQQNANRYAYAGGDPINLLDPAGTGVFDDVAEGFGVVATGIACATAETGVGAAACVVGLAGVTAGAGGIAASASEERERRNARPPVH